MRSSGSSLIDPKPRLETVLELPKIPRLSLRRALRFRFKRSRLAVNNRDKRRRESHGLSCSRDHLRDLSSEPRVELQHCDDLCRFFDSQNLCRIPLDTHGRDRIIHPSSMRGDSCPPKFDAKWSAVVASFVDIFERDDYALTVLRYKPVA